LLIIFKTTTNFGVFLYDLTSVAMVSF